MEVIDLARLQFALTTVFHFVYVPISIGLVAHCRDYGDDVCQEKRRKI